MIATLIALFLGSLLTVVLLAAGIVIGYFIGSKRLTEVAEQIETKVRTSVAKDEGGPIKAITQKEIVAEKDKPVADRMQELIEP
jgi:UPF0716 family protein affecting phage T7 exclusion